MEKPEALEFESEEENEIIEPQVREAAKILKEKGYKIGSLAGQAGDVEEGRGKQAIIFSHPRKKNGANPFDKKTMELLKELGVKPYSDEMPNDMIGLEFATDEAKEGMPEIRSKWTQIALILPSVDSTE